MSFKSPYGANPITLYSSEFTVNPRKYVNDEYSNPNEWGKNCGLISDIFPFIPFIIDVVAISPTASTTNIAASL